MNMLSQLEKIKVIESCRCMKFDGFSNTLISKKLLISETSVRRYTKGISRPILFKNKKEYIPPQAIKPSEDFAYLLGIYYGDGYFSNSGKGYNLRIACSAKHHNYLIGKYSELIEKVTGLKSHLVSHKNGSVVEIKVYSKDLPYLLELKAGKKSHSICVPEWIFSDKIYLRYFIRGLIETDGSVTYKHSKNNCKSWTVSFTQVNPSIMEAFLNGVNILGYVFTNKTGIRALLVGGAVEANKFIKEMQLEEKIIKYNYIMNNEYAICKNAL